jgi:hypothetical protein
LRSQTFFLCLVFVMLRTNQDDTKLTAGLRDVDLEILRRRQSQNLKARFSWVELTNVNIGSIRSTTAGFESSGTGQHLSLRTRLLGSSLNDQGTKSTAGLLDDVLQSVMKKSINSSSWAHFKFKTLNHKYLTVNSW